LVQAHQSVENGQPQNNQSRRQVLKGDDAHHGSPEQHQLHQILVLTEKRSPPGLLDFFSQPVRTIEGTTLCHFRTAKPLVGVHVELSVHLLDWHFVPVQLTFGPTRRRRRHR
jgi:hypothetical protein